MDSATESSDNNGASGATLSPSSSMPPPAQPAAAAAKAEGEEKLTITGHFTGELAQARIWSSLRSESSLRGVEGRSAALEADATLICLWKVDEGAGGVLRNSRPLHPPKPPRGAKTTRGSGGGGRGTGAEGHAELMGESSWVPCFDPGDYDKDNAGAGSEKGKKESSVQAASDAAAESGSGVAASSSLSAMTTRAGHEGAKSTPPEVSSDGGGGDGRGDDAASPAVAEEDSGSRSTDTDLAQSLGWRSVSTAGDEEEGAGRTGEGGEEADDGRDKGVEPEGNEARCTGSSKGITPSAGAGVVIAAAGASAALDAYAAIGSVAAHEGDGFGDGSARDEVSAREALLGVLGKLFQQSSVYLAPCQADPLAESLQPPLPRGMRTVEARVQLQLVRREERALGAIVQPEVRGRLCVCNGTRTHKCAATAGIILILERRTAVA